MKRFMLAWKGFWALLNALKAADTAVSARFSDEWWVEVRKQLEIKLVAVYQRADKGLLRLFESDNAFLRGAMILTKSSAMYEIYVAKNNKDRVTAVDRLMAKDSMRTLDEIKKYPTH